MILSSVTRDFQPVLSHCILLDNNVVVYFLFSRSVCRKQEHIQLDLERLENELSYIAQQKEQLVSTYLLR